MTEGAKTPQQLAQEGRYIEAGAIAENATRVIGFKLIADERSSGSGNPLTFSGHFVLEGGRDIIQFERVGLNSFEDAYIDFTEPVDIKFLGYAIPVVDKLEDFDDD